MANVNAANVEEVLSSGITSDVLTSIKNRLTALEAIVPTPKAADAGKALVAGNDGTASWTTIE